MSSITPLTLVGADACSAASPLNRTGQQDLRRFIVKTSSALLFSVALLGGCAPIPHFERVAPGISGAVTVEGKPAIGAVILNCEPRSEVTCIDNSRHAVGTDGRFTLEENKHLRLFTVLGDVKFGWGFDIEKDGTVYFGYRRESTGIVLEQLIKVSCELSDAAARGASHVRPACRETSN
jgi:hypothetical protein